MEVLADNVTTRKTFDMRLEQLLMKHPGWFCEGRDTGFATAKDGRGRLYTIFIEDCKDEQALERLEDSRYYLSSRVEYSDVRDFYIFGTHKYVARLDLEFLENALCILVATTTTKKKKSRIDVYSFSYSFLHDYYMALYYQTLDNTSIRDTVGSSSIDK